MVGRIVLLLLMSLLTLQIALGQERLKTSSGTVSFDASSPLEDIKAVNDQVNAILDVGSGEMAAVLLIQDFEFRRKLMQEHFNENYLHSETYPKAIFTGTIQNFQLEDLGTEYKSFELSGDITIHGVTQPLETKVKLRTHEKGIDCSLEFVVRTEAHKIKVPRVVFKKVAEEVNVAAEFRLAPQ